MREYSDFALRGALDRFKRHLRITSDDLDADLRGKLVAAIMSAEQMIGKVILRSQFSVTVPFSRSIRLKGPETEILSVTIDGQASEAWTLSGRTLSLTGSGQSVSIVYEAGYTCPPENIIAAIMLHGASLFANVADSVETLTKASDNLLRPYRTYGLDDDGDGD